MKINELFKVRKGTGIELDGSAPEIETYLVETKDVGSCIINYRNSGLQKVKARIDEKYFLKPGDIIIASIPSVETSHVGYCRELNGDRAIIKKNFFILRDPFNTELYNLEFLAEYLEEFGIPKAYEENKESPFIAQDIEEIELPDISREKQEELMKLIKPINERHTIYNNLIKCDDMIKKHMMNEVINNEK